MSQQILLHCCRSCQVLTGNVPELLNLVRASRASHTPALCVLQQGGQPTLQSDSVSDRHIFLVVVIQAVLGAAECLKCVVANFRLETLHTVCVLTALLVLSCG